MARLALILSMLVADSADLLTIVGTALAIVGSLAFVPPHRRD